MRKRNIGVIYAGGTFGSAPTDGALTPLDKEIFLPLLSPLLGDAKIIDNHITKDSSALTPADFVHFYNLIATHYEQYDGFVLITGTDTLAYLAAFLHIALWNSPVCVVVTGSMHPLLSYGAKNNPEDMKINPASDAGAHLAQALAQARFGEHGVYVAFGELYHGIGCQKIHSTDSHAFVGYRARTPLYNKNNKQTLAGLRFDNIRTLTCPHHSAIATLFALPNDYDATAQLLRALANTKPKAIILQGFGTGNLAPSSALQSALEYVKAQDISLITTSQCAMGGAGSDYATGAWLAKYSKSGGIFSLPTVYALVLWWIVQDKRWGDFERFIEKMHMALT